MVTPEDFGGSGYDEVPFREANGGKIYRFLVSITVALTIGFAFSYLFGEKWGHFFFFRPFLRALVP
ncbi:hypothetical protein [Thermococcus sp.]